MSDVISYRLDKDNPREEKARRVLKAWYEEDYSLRYILTEASLMLDEPQPDQSDSNVLTEVNEKLDHINHLPECVGNAQPNSNTKQNEGSSQTNLPDAFISSISKVAKPGQKLD
ncbi:MAG: hypothetical protein MUO64_02365 [Anaerolineales bacterium]|nr:hypothetical protein [Anaerolineales bacterium]